VTTGLAITLQAHPPGDPKSPGSASVLAMELHDQQRDVLAAVRAAGQTTVSELARVTGLPAMMVKKLLGELEADARVRQAVDADRGDVIWSATVRGADLLDAES
jgi:predicted ArsR family transcriptional regulator